jgi:hypothetical protein
VEAHGHRAGAEPKPLGDLAEWEILDVFFHQHAACIGRQQRQRAVEQLGQLGALQIDGEIILSIRLLLGVRRSIRVALDRRRQVRLLAPAPPNPAQREVARDRR